MPQLVILNSIINGDNPLFTVKIQKQLCSQKFSREEFCSANVFPRNLLISLKTESPIAHTASKKNFGL